MSGHTPGPWEIDFSGRSDPPTAALVSGKRLRIIVDHREDFGDPLPDAHLIAAAPDLYYALRDLATRCDGLEGERADGSNIQTMAAHAALAKAEGK